MSIFVTAVKPSINEQKEIIGLRKLITSTWKLPVSDAQLEKFLKEAFAFVKIHMPRLITPSPQYGLNDILLEKAQSYNFDYGNNVGTKVYQNLANYLANVFATGKEHLQVAKEEFEMRFAIEVKDWNELNVVSGSHLVTDLKHNGKQQLAIVKEWNKSILKQIKQFGRSQELYDIFMSGLFNHIASVVAYEQERIIHEQVEAFDKHLTAFGDSLKTAQYLDVSWTKEWTSPVLKSFLVYIQYHNLEFFKKAEDIAKAKEEKKKVKEVMTVQDGNDFMAAMAGVKPLSKKPDTKSTVGENKAKSKDSAMAKYLEGDFDK